MNKTALTLVAALGVLAGGAASAQIGKAASEASDAAGHKIDQKRADQKAKESGLVGKAVNGVKSEYHEKRADHSANKAKDSLRNVGK